MVMSLDIEVSFNLFDLFKIKWINAKPTIKDKFDSTSKAKIIKINPINILIFFCLIKFLYPNNKQ